LGAKEKQIIGEAKYSVTLWRHRFGESKNFRAPLKGFGLPNRISDRNTNQRSKITEGITMKKLVFATILSLALLTALPMTAFAHGHGNAASTVNRTGGPCAVTNCNIVGNHYHDGVPGAGHSIGDGHDYHQVCTVKNCAKTGSHTHDGVECLPHTNGDGRGYHGSRGGGGHC
jgi:hypothetical protein